MFLQAKSYVPLAERVFDRPSVNSCNHAGKELHAAISSAWIGSLLSYCDDWDTVV